MVDMMSSRCILGRGDDFLLILQQPWRNLRYPLSLVRGAPSVPEGAGKYLFLQFLCDFFG